MVAPLSAGVWPHSYYPRLLNFPMSAQLPVPEIFAFTETHPSRSLVWTVLSGTPALLWVWYSGHQLL